MSDFNSFGLSPKLELGVLIAGGEALGLILEGSAGGFRVVVRSTIRDARRG